VATHLFMCKKGYALLLSHKTQLLGDNSHFIQELLHLTHLLF